MVGFARFAGKRVELLHAAAEATDQRHLASCEDRHDRCILQFSVIRAVNPEVDTGDPGRPESATPGANKQHVAMPGETENRLRCQAADFHLVVIAIDDGFAGLTINPYQTVIERAGPHIVGFVDQ